MISFDLEAQDERTIIHVQNDGGQNARTVCYGWRNRNIYSLHAWDVFVVNDVT